MPDNLARTARGQNCDPNADEQRHLATLEGKLQVVRDFTRSVATGRTTGLYLFGTGGCGKSYTVIKELERLQVPYKLFNSRMTGRGLYNQLEEFPDSIHLLEDMEQLFRDTGARGVLRSALWTQGARDDDGPQERLVTWTTFRSKHSCVFTGGLIMTANRPFPEIPELAAIKTRIAYNQLLVSENELIAMMRHLARQGHRRGSEFADPEECKDVCDFIIDECRGLNRQLDLRLYVNGMADYFQWRDCESGCGWKDLVSARIKERPTKIREAETYTARADQKQAELDLARELSEIDDRGERFRIWHERTGKSEPTLYRRIQETDTQPTLA